jgi:hypothetical protein
LKKNKNYRQQRIGSSGGLGGLQKSVLSITFAARWTETLQVSATCAYARNVTTYVKKKQLHIDTLAALDNCDSN